MAARRIFLTGFMGTGKTTVGRALARSLGLELVDLDQEIERRCGLTVVELFDRRGESEFRRLEHELLAEICGRDEVVVATGGGCFVREENQRLIEAAGHSVWLDVPFERILDRISDHGRRNRPLLADVDTARDLFARRRSHYDRADLRIPLTGFEDPAQVAEHIATLLRELPCAI